jgi:hypothetical protein
MPNPSSYSAQAGRLSLPACAEDVLRAQIVRKGKAFSVSRRTEPHVIIDRIKRYLAMPASRHRERSVGALRLLVHGVLEQES